MLNRPAKNSSRLLTFRVNLKEIPEDGRDYALDRESGELNNVLADLIGDRAYDVNLHIKPLGNAYELSGRISASTPELCSKCGADIDVPVNREVREFLVEDQEEFRNAQSIHGNGAIDFLNDASSATTYQGGVFDLGEYVHESIALAEPFYPACPNGACPNLAEIAAKRAELERQFQEAELGVGHSAFAALKELKLSES